MLNRFSSNRYIINVGLKVEKFEGVDFMLSALISLVTSCLIVPIMTYFLNRRSRKVANSESDILDAISILKNDVNSADRELAVISQDIFAFVYNGNDLTDDHTRHFSSSKMQLARDWETYGYHFSNKDINHLMHNLLDELDKADKSVMNINSFKEVPKYTTSYDCEGPEVKKLCSLLNDERKKLIK